MGIWLPGKQLMASSNPIMPINFKNTGLWKEKKFYRIEAEKNGSSEKAMAVCMKFCGICSWGSKSSLKKMKALTSSLEQ